MWFYRSSTSERQRLHRKTKDSEPKSTNNSRSYLYVHSDNNYCAGRNVVFNHLGAENRQYGN